MNEHIAKLQSALGGLTVDGERGPRTTIAILTAADEGRLTVAPALPGDGLGPLPTLPWLEELKAVFGLHENADREKLTAWLKSDGHALGDPTKLPWCGDAVETSMRLGMPQEPFPGALGANPYFARNWTQFGVDLKAYGSVGVFERGPTSGHVGYLVGEGPSTYYVFGGNQGDRVSVVQILKTRLIAARFPSTWLGPVRPLPKMNTLAPLSISEF